MAESSQGSSNSPTDPVGVDVEDPSQRFARLRAPHGMSLSQRMRPQNLHDILGQNHLLGPRGSFNVFLHPGDPSSFWLVGPPSSGKISTAISAARFLDIPFLGILFPGSDSQLLRQVLFEAERSPTKPSMLFMNNLPEFTPQDQEILLPYISNGSIILCGSSTIDPHGLVSPLILSQCSFFELRKLEPRHVEQIVRGAIDDKVHGLVQSLFVNSNLVMDDDAIEFLCSNVDGNARFALNILEYVAFKIITNDCFPDSSGAGRTLRELLQILKDLHGAKQCEYVQPFMQFQNGLLMAHEEFKQQPFVVHITLSCVQDALSM